MDVIDNKIFLEADADGYGYRLWDNDYIEFKDGILYCKDIILNPNFSIKGGVITCRDLYFNGKRYDGSLPEKVK